MENENEIELPDPAIIMNWTKGSVRRQQLAEVFLNPEFKKMIAAEIVRLKDLILNLSAPTDMELGVEFKKYKQQLFVWEQLQQATQIFTDELKRPKER